MTAVAPLVSVLMPAYNVAPYIRHAIDSILAQTHSDFELLVQDDGSHDETCRIVAEIAARDPRVRLLPSFPQNRGVVAARNALLAAARGEFICWMDSDDVAVPRRLELQLAFLRQNPKVGAVGSAIALADDELYVYDALFFPKDMSRQRNDPYIACQTIMARAAATHRAGGFRELFRLGGEDGDWLLRIADDWDIATLDDVLYVYRLRGGLSRTNAAEIRRLGVIARVAAAERRAGRPDPIDSISSEIAVEAISDTAFLELDAASVDVRYDVLSQPLNGYPPLVSVILAVREGAAARMIERCCEWLSKQHFRNFEIVVCHPPGWSLPDGCTQLLSGIPTSLLAVPVDPLTAAGLDRILSAARGQLILWQHSEDYPRETRVGTFVRAALAQLDTLAIGFAINLVDEQHVLRSETFDAAPFCNGVFQGYAGTFGFRRQALATVAVAPALQECSFDLVRVLRQLDEQGTIVNAPDISCFVQYAASKAVSVLLDVARDEAKLENCLAGLATQTMPDFEIVASLGPGLSKAARAKAEDLLERASARIIATPIGASVTDRVNALLASCSGRFVLWHPPGDVSARHRLQTLVDYMTANPDCNAVGSAVFDSRHGSPRIFPRRALNGGVFAGVAESYLIRRRTALIAGRLRRSLPLRHALQDFLERISPSDSVHNVEQALYLPARLERSMLEPSGAPLLRRVVSMVMFVAKRRRQVLSSAQSEPAVALPQTPKQLSEALPEKPLREVILVEAVATAAAPVEKPRIIARCHDNWYDFDDALRYLTPGGSGVFGGVAFVRDDERTPDWQVIFNHPGNAAVRFEARPDRVIFAVGEPPTKPFRHLQLGQGRGTTVMTSDEELAASCNPARRFVLTPCMTRTWSMKRPYDELKRTMVAEKPGRLSWVTSNLAMVAGHHKRLGFLERLRKKVDFDLYGRGFRPIQDKWPALAPYRYSIAFENSRERFYFTEKIMDCFVAETMPIYFGCPNILDFFPAESMIIIDPDDPDVFARIEEAIHSDAYIRNRDAVMEAKRRVLDEYNLFARLSRFMNEAPEATARPVPLVAHPIQLDFSDDGETTPHVDLAFQLS